MQRATIKILKRYYSQGHDKTERLGQFFLNRYLPDTQWPKLYYNEDTVEAAHIIDRWLFNNGFTEDVPPDVSLERTKETSQEAN
jgi:hypothetical protein